MAPLDADAIYCFDASNGQLCWQQDVNDVVHLLGASRERVFFTTSRGLQSVEVADSSAARGVGSSRLREVSPHSDAGCSPAVGCFGPRKIRGFPCAA